MNVQRSMGFLAVIIAVVALLSIINTGLTNNVTGAAVLDLSTEFQGIGILIVIVFGVLGLYAIRGYHKGEELPEAIKKAPKEIKKDIKKALK